MKFPIFLFAGLVALTMVGCSDDSVASSERNERSGALFEEALSAEASGDVVKAETLYLQVLTNDATNASAHLNLAMLLHEQKKDYVGALHHYSSYLDLQPTAEKVPLVKDQIEVARALLAEQLATAIVNRKLRDLEAEYSGIRDDLTTTKATLGKVREELSTKDDEIAELKRKIKQQDALIQAMKDAEVEQKKVNEAELAAARKALEDAQKKVEEETAEESTDDLVRSVREDALRMIEEEDGGQKERNEETRKALEGVEDEIPIASAPTPGKRYLVRPGDTLSKLAREAYGKDSLWTKIRDANRSTTNPDGRLRAGETVLIP